MSILNLSQFCIGLGLGFSATFVPFITEKGFGEDEGDIPSSSEIGFIGWFPKNSQNHQQSCFNFLSLSFRHVHRSDYGRSPRGCIRLCTWEKVGSRRDLLMLRMP